MMTFAFAPLIFACMHWYRRSVSLATIDKNLDLLQRLRQLCRSSVALPKSRGGDDILSVVSEAADMGMSCSASLAQSALWLRLFKIQSIKAHRLFSMWFLRLLAVFTLSVVVRLWLSESSMGALLGMSSSDKILIFLSCMSALMGTVLFLKLVPTVEIEGDSEVFGLAAWLKDRILIESGFPVASVVQKIQSIERGESSSGLSLSSEKIEALDEIWRSRIESVEKKAEAASEIMPFLELVFFGLFILCMVLEPGLKFGM